MSRSEPGAAEIGRALSDGAVQGVPASGEAARGLLASARRHLASAGAVIEGDPEGAYALAYDAARKAATALLAAQGLRIRSVRGHHALLAKLAAAQFGHDFERLEQMHRTRNRSEYPDHRRHEPPVDTDEATMGLRRATSIVAAAEQLLDSGRLGQFPAPR